MVLILINVGSIHLIDGATRSVGKSFVAQAMFFYCLKVLGLVGLESLDFSGVDAAISSEKRRQKRQRNFGSFYSTLSNNSDDDVDDIFVERFVDCKYKNIPLLLVKDKIDRNLVFSIYKLSEYRRIYETYGDLIQDVVFGVGLGGKDAVNTIFEAAKNRVVIVDVGSYSGNVVRDWWGCEDIPDLIEAIPTKLVRWFVSKEDSRDLDLFVDSVNKYSERMTHVLVQNKNSGLDDVNSNWKLLKESPYLEAVERSLLMDFPLLENGCALAISDGRSTYEDVANKGASYGRYYTEKDRMFECWAMNSFIDKVSACFASSGQFDSLLEFSKSFKLS